MEKEYGRIKLILPDSQKTDEWYKAIMERSTPHQGLDYEAYYKQLRPYSLLNNDLTPFKDELTRLCNPASGIEPEHLQDLPISFNRIFSKYQFLIGQMLSRGDRFSTLLIGERELEEMDDKYREAWRNTIQEKILLKLEEMMLRSDGEKDADIQKFVQENGGYDIEAIDKKTFKTDSEKFYSKLLEYFYLKYDFPEMKSLAFSHILAGSKCSIAVMNIHGQPTPVVLNNVHFNVRKSPDTLRYEHGDAWFYTTPLTKTQVLDEIGNDYTEEEIDEKTGFVSGYSDLWDVRKGAEPDIRNDLFDAVFNRFGNHNIGQSMNTSSIRDERYCWKTYMEFKAYKNIIFLTSYDETGKTLVDIVSEGYPIPKSAVEKDYVNRYGRKTKRHEWVDEFGMPMYAEKMPIPWKYEVTRYGSGMYHNMREVPNQTIDIDDPYGSFELSAKGMNFGSLNAEPISLIERATSSQLQYDFLKLLQMREMSKYDGIIKAYDVDMIPQWLVEDDEGNPIFEGADRASVMRFYIRKLGEFWFSGSQGSGGLQQGGRPSPIKTELGGNFAEIINMQNMLELIDREIGLQMLVLPQSEGIITPYSTATDNQQAVQTGQTVMEHYHLLYNMVWKSVINEWVHQFVKMYQNFFRENPDSKDTYLYYIIPEGTRESLQVKPEYLDHESIGIYLHDTKVDEQYRMQMANYIQPIAQNAGEGTEVISELVMALVRGDSPEQVHQKIIKTAKAQQDRSERMQQMQQQMQERSEQRLIQEREDAQAHQIEIELIRKAAKLEATAMQVTSFQEDRDVDDSGVDDALENRQAMHSMLMKEKDMNIKQQKVELDKQKLKQATKK